MTGNSETSEPEKESRLFSNTKVFALWTLAGTFALLAFYEVFLLVLKLVQGRG